MKFSRIASASAVAATVTAQQVEWGQCGGMGWTGPTTCVSGTVCTFSNPYYSQCLPGTAPPPTTLSTSTKATSTVSKATSTSTKASSTPTVPAGTFAKAVGRVFNIDGKVGYFAGTNAYYIGFLTNNADVDLIMSHLQTTGLKVLRVWGFNDVNQIPGSGTVWFQALVPGSAPQINTGANGLQRLDYVVSSAAAHGIKLIINFTNNWTDYGGMQAYVNYYGGAITDWYTSATMQAQYQAYIAAVVSRYKTSTAVFAWELANEPRCTGCATSVITNWATTTSKYIKSLDPNHMVTMGEEGFGLNGGSDTSYPFTNGPGTNFTNDLAIPDIDFGTMHLYPSSWGEVDTWGPSWILDHDAVGQALGKPVILEEYGSLTTLNEQPWQQTVLQSGIAGDMYWQYGDDLSTGETNNDGYAIYYGTSLYTTLVTDHAAAMNAKAAP